MLIGSGLSEHEENGVNEGSIAQDERNKSQKPSKTPSYGGKFKKSHISTKIQRIIIATEKYRDRSLRLLKNNKPCKKAGFIVNLGHVTCPFLFKSPELVRLVLTFEYFFNKFCIKCI